MIKTFQKNQCKKCPIKNCNTTKDVIECFLAYVQFRKDYIKETKQEPSV
jgi:hypothetical protein